MSFAVFCAPESLSRGSATTMLVFSPLLFTSLFLSSALKTSVSVTSLNGLPMTRSVNSARPSSLKPLMAARFERHITFS